ESARLFARTTIVVSDTKVHSQLRCNLDVVLCKERIRKESQCRIDRLVAVKGKLGPAGDQAGDGPTLIEIACVGCLVASEVEVPTDVIVVCFMHVLYAYCTAESPRVLAFD